MKNKILIYLCVVLLAGVSIAATGVGISAWTKYTEAIADGDFFALTDISDTNKSDSGTNKAATGTQVKSWLKAYDDTLFVPIASETFSGNIKTTGDIYGGNYYSTAADGAVYSNIYNTTALSSTATLGRIAGFGGELRWADGTDWDGYFLRDAHITPTKVNTNVLEWHFNATQLAASATVPDEGMAFRIPYGVTFGTATVDCDGTATAMVIDLAHAATRYGTYTDEDGTGITLAASPLDASGYTALTAGQFLSARVSTASTGAATMCDLSLTLINN